MVLSSDRERQQQSAGEVKKVASTLVRDVSEIVAQMLRNLEAEHGNVEFKAPLVVAAPTYNIIEELKEVSGVSRPGEDNILQKLTRPKRQKITSRGPQNRPKIVNK